jgi:hypothetical protein
VQLTRQQGNMMKQFGKVAVIMGGSSAERECR